MTAQEQQSIQSAAQTLQSTAQALLTVIGAVAPNPGNIAGGLNNVPINGNPIITPPQPFKMTWLRYHPEPSDSINARDGSQTDPRLLSTEADAKAIAKEAGIGEPYLSPGITIPGPSKRQVWLTDVPGLPPGAVAASQMIAQKFDYYTLDVSGAMMAPKGKWINGTYVYDDPTIRPW